ncbi:ADP-ribosylglycohydrolase-domain-containing protein [Cercophora scortea]|uniref:ADP-ribosylglycohydrolase-domain-containing protein n=1 Tax=Cercophora scortea TaxID=314031 RepID=A0AAE0IDS2_9PEZI|nr:ADP-ribosylglycohydrolase-domain-containing protein [Cercophora scortea]
MSSSRPNPSPRANTTGTAVPATNREHDHAPANPSGLRKSYTPFYGSSPDRNSDRRDSEQISPTSPPVNLSNEPISYLSIAGPSIRGQSTSAAPPTESTALLGDGLEFGEHAHEGPCNHGTFSPRPMSPAGSIPSESHTDSESEATMPLMDGVITQDARKKSKSWKGQLASKMRSKKMSTSSALAERHGVEDSGLMYLSYYLPVLVWAREYSWAYFKGDLVAALTVAGMYVPMALSLAANLAHVPPINGLYSFVFNPLVYALLGSCPAMIVGPEAAGSLLVGTVVKASVDLGRGEDDDAQLHAKICGIVAGLAGAMVFVAGVARLGFLDSVLSRPFLRGFISAIGVVIAVDQLVPELGLTHLAEHSPGVSHGSSIDKLRFIFSNLDSVHGLTFAIAATSFAVIMLCREVKRRLQPRYPGVAYIPDRFLIVVVSAFLAYWFEWEKAGVQVLGKVEAASGHTFTFSWPFQMSNMTHIRDAMSTSFLIALLGFFESSVAAKSLGGDETFAGIQLSPNRELVALGAANLVGACFMSLPAFGGYGRSKVNKSTGGRSPMSSILLSLLTLICILFLLPYLYYLPKPVLSSLISVVAWSLVEECPHDISFFLRIHAWQELALMITILLSTIFFSLPLGMAIGVGLSLLQVIRHATRPRIQILGRLPGTNRFENAEANPERLEFIEGCLIVKIPEPLTFANTGELKARLRRLELYGTSQAHPALPRLRREDSNRNIVFDIHGVTSLDGSGMQVLEEIVRSYRDRGVRIFFSRGPDTGSDVWKMMQRSGVVDLVGGQGHFVDDVHDALKMTEVEEGGEQGVVDNHETGPARLRSNCIDFAGSNTPIMIKTHNTRLILSNLPFLPILFTETRNPSNHQTTPPSPPFPLSTKTKTQPNQPKMSTPPPSTRQERILGALLGVHAGDSLGATVEFLPWSAIQRSRPMGVRDIIGGGSLGWAAGQATDDTDLTRAVLLAYRDVEKARRDSPTAPTPDVVTIAADYMVSWMTGHEWPGRKPNSRPRDIGGATAAGLRKYRVTKDARKAGAGEGRAGNGSLMRCIPTALFGEPEKLAEESAAISAVTHDDQVCVGACVAYNAMARALVDGRTAEEAYQAGMEVELQLASAGAVEKVREAIAGGRLISIADVATKGPKEAANASKVLRLQASGYVLESLSLAVAAMLDPRPMEEVLIDVVRFGNDADTNGAIAGGLLGARDGVEAIPLRWRRKLQFREEFEEVVKFMLEGAGELGAGLV